MSCIGRIFDARFKFHGRNEIFTPRHCFLKAINDETHTKERRSQVIDQGDEQNHLTNRKLLLGRLNKNIGKDEEKDDAQNQPTNDVHFVPITWLLARHGDSFTVTFSKMSVLQTFTNIAFDHFDLRYDFCKSAASHIDFVIFIWLEITPFFAGQHRQPDEQRIQYQYQ